ncbi:hypothetical protein IHE45_20G029300 [Dioscorea alata]|uniref:Uncharacterized protein n=1 Tax=Dioscorea alata TaxID=55571 RepID=A0ACB7TTC0_DIOAL|nr:hypothetical protein IHE45_20G029300 [Dioscorea alata]
MHIPTLSIAPSCSSGGPSDVILYPPSSDARSGPVEQVDYVGQTRRFQNNPYSNTYNPGWRNHLIFSWSSQSGQEQRVPQQQHALPPPLAQSPPSSSSSEQTPDITSMMAKFIKSIESRFSSNEEMIRNTNATVRNLEHQMAQLSKLVEERLPGSLPSNTVVNPREYLKGVQLRSGKQVENPVEKPPTEEHINPTVVVDVEALIEESYKEKEPVVEYQPKLPYPVRMQKEKQEEQLKKFLDVFKTLHINVPFVEALAQMPKYAKFLKELLTKKRKLEEVSSMTLSEECSALICNKLPKKEKDPGGFIVPCTIGGLVDKKSPRGFGGKY